MGTIIGSHIEGWMSDVELKWLYEQAQEMETIVEIGSWCGRSTYALCSGCRGTVYAIDHFLGSQEHQDMIKERTVDIYTTFMNNMKEFSNLEVLKMTSKQAARSKKIPEVVDMVFLDGSHDYKSVMTDLKLWYPRVKKIICGHDFQENGVPKAIDEFFKKSYIVVAGTVIWKVDK